MKTKIRQIATFFLAACVLFSGLPFMAGDIDAHAMAKKKVAKNVTLRASANGQTRANLSWNKIKKPQKGYAVFRDGRAIAHCGKRLSFSDSGLRAGTTYRYQIKVYKTKKVKQWYNKKTGQWQKKKPKKKYRGKRRTITSYSYQKPSNTVYVKTAAAPKPVTVGVPQNVSGTENNGKVRITWSAVSGADHYRVYRNSQYKNTTCLYFDDSIDPSKTYTYTVTAFKGNVESARSKAVTLGGETGEIPISEEATSSGAKNAYGDATQVTVTDYLGVTRTIRKETSRNLGTYWTDGSIMITDDKLPRYDRTLDGTFTASGNVQMKQVGGATFNLNELSSPGKISGNYVFTAYNTSASRLKIVQDRDVTIDEVPTFEWTPKNDDVSDHTLKSITRYYFTKNGRRIAETTKNPATIKKVSGTKYTVGYTVYSEEEEYMLGRGNGIFNGTFKATVYYDNTAIGTFNVNTCKNPVNGMTPKRRLMLQEAQTAINAMGGSTGTIEGDIGKITLYIQDNKRHGEAVSGYGVNESYGCQFCTGVLETWLIYNYGDAGYGFAAWGSSSDPDHVAYHLNSNKNKYWDILIF